MDEPKNFRKVLAFLKFISDERTRGSKLAVNE
jgi:hypothetical protein